MSPKRREDTTLRGPRSTTISSIEYTAKTTISGCKDLLTGLGCLESTVRKLWITTKSTMSAVLDILHSKLKWGKIDMPASTQN